MKEKRMERKRKLKEAFDRNYDTDRVGNAVSRSEIIKWCSKFRILFF